MHWAIEAITPEHAERLCRWKYEDEYSIYDREEADVADVLDPASGDLALIADGDFVGFCSFGADGQVPGGSYDDEAVDIGIGLSPAHVGRGLGAAAVESVVAFAASRYPGKALRATIASFNLRSRRTFEKAGFVDEAEFLGPNGRPFRQYLRRAPTAT